MKARTLTSPRWQWMLVALALLGQSCATTDGKTTAKTARLDNFLLTGKLSGNSAEFTLTATALVPMPEGGTLELVSGDVALIKLGKGAKWHMEAETNRFLARFERGGKYPIEVKFRTAVRQASGWNYLAFKVASAPILPINLEGLPAATQFEFPGAARPERVKDQFVSFLPADGNVQIGWKESAPEAEGKLFYASELLSQVGLGPGLMRQTALLTFKVMQGEMTGVTLLVSGQGEVTRIQGENVLSWNIQPAEQAGVRKLVIQFNQPQRESASLQVQVQTALGKFPQTVDVVQVRPEGAVRHTGWYRVLNEGAVRLEVSESRGVSQTGPEQFPVTDAFASAAGTQRFVYRYTGGDFALRVTADQVLPELAVSQVVAFRYGENELSIDAEFEVDIREAPLRELLLRIPQGYVVARLTANGLADHFLTEAETAGQNDLRLVFAQPVTGRQLVQLRLERNRSLAQEAWTLPQLVVGNAKSVRGHLAVAADAGYRLTPEKTEGLTEIATAFFPRKLPDLQSAFRLNESGWQAVFRIEKLPQTVQADCFHLFSIGEGIAYGSSLMNIQISGAPLSAFQVELSPEYAKVEFTGKDVRSWQKNERGYLVQLHTPAAGKCMLLASYERPFKNQGETLGFTGARPLDAQSEQGYTVVISAYQFQVKPAEVSANLLPLEPGEIPAEYRLLFDAPVLACYRYSTRPFNLALGLTPLEQGESLSQVVDRVSLVTRISREGQVVTDASYYVKSRGQGHLRCATPKGMQLWAATVNGASVVPVADGEYNLVPLPSLADPNTVLRVELKWAGQSKEARLVKVSAPAVDAPVLLADWKLLPDTGRKLVFKSGTLTPADQRESTAAAAVARLFGGARSEDAWLKALAGLVLVLGALLAWRWATQPGVCRGSARHLAGTAIGLAALAGAVVAWVTLAALASRTTTTPADQVALLAPVQQAGSTMWVEVQNLAKEVSFSTVVARWWPALVAAGLWFLALVNRSAGFRPLLVLAGWGFLLWGALRLSDGAPAFILAAGGAFVVQTLLPAGRRLFALPRAPQSSTTPPIAGASQASASALLLAGLFFASSAQAAVSPGIAQVVQQEIRVEESFGFGTVRIRWNAEKGQVLPFLRNPAVLTSIHYPSNALALEPASSVEGSAHSLQAKKAGTFEFEARYQLRVQRTNNEQGFELAVPYGLINTLTLTLTNRDLDIRSPQAVSVEKTYTESNTVARLVLPPAAKIWVGWQPRTRDASKESTVFYSELQQFYVPAAGTIEGIHLVSIRPAQGELDELLLTLPLNATATDVMELGATQSIQQVAANQTGLVSLWRFDPDSRRLKISFARGQSKPFALLVRTQLPTGPLPIERELGLLKVQDAAGQLGLLGLGTASDVQLDAVQPQNLTQINLEDFPAQAVQLLQAQMPGLNVRRAFRYSDAEASLSLKASAVQPDVRVEAQDTVSMGEDRTVLASSLAVDIARAGIFKLSFGLPEGFDVESLSGAAMSHWTESKTSEGRVITVHLTGKTEGNQKFVVSLAGPGVRATNAWTVPQLLLREANKQKGTLLVVPEQGFRVQIASAEGVSQLDPQASGVRQRGVLAFRVLQVPWRVVASIEQVPAWVQVTTLQHALVGEANVKVTANLQYQIENAGLKAFRILVPTNAESVHFHGEQVADFRPLPDAITNDLKVWEIKLQRRVIGAYMLHLNYETRIPEGADTQTLRSVEATGVSLQRGFVTVQSAGRTQLRIDSTPPSLQPAEWQSIPRTLQQDLAAAPANFSFRLVEPSFSLPLKVERHEAAKLLPARVNSVAMKSVVSDEGVVLTEVRMEIIPGDKRLLNLTLPRQARFWFAFVNQNGVWPWREQERVLIPLEQPDSREQPILVEFYYSVQARTTADGIANLELLAPKVDLPLENVTWRISVSERWSIKDWKQSTLQYERLEVTATPAAVDLGRYLQEETQQQQQRSKQAEQMLAFGNSALAKGDPQQARRAFQNAYGLSTHDSAFNEDARVQLNNVKLQQALVGLNVRQAAVSGAATELPAKAQDQGGGKQLAFTQQDAKRLLDNNTADENAALMKLAERLVQQQDAAVSSPVPLRASVPEQGKVLTFRRAIVVEPWADLKVCLQVAPLKGIAPASNLGVVVLVLGMVALAMFAGRRLLADNGTV